MSNILVWWQGRTRIIKLASIFVGMLLAYCIVYFLGNGILYTTVPTSPDYVVARTSGDDISNVAIKKTTALWNIEPTSAKNVSHMKISVGDKVRVQKYWWFGNHTYVRDIYK